MQLGVGPTILYLPLVALLVALALMPCYSTITGFLFLYFVASPSFLQYGDYSELPPRQVTCFPYQQI